MRLRNFQPDINKNLRLGVDQLTLFLSDFVATVQNPRTKRLLASALELVRPQHLALGIRVSRLSTTHVEVVVPNRRKNQTLAGELDPGVLVTASLLGADLLLSRMDQPHVLSPECQRVEWQKFRSLKGAPLRELRGRLEITKLNQETLKLEIRKRGESHLELMMNFYDGEEQRVAECQMSFICREQNQLNWKDSSQ
mgnify:CR=1 FL=1